MNTNNLRFSTALFAIAILTGSLLLFLIQPMFAKLALPLLGGAPSVWNTCMLFFQAVLLMGYAYAHLSVNHLGLRRQPLVHLLVLMLPALWLPFGTLEGVAPSDGAPTLWLLVLLTSIVGIPFFVISTSAPLLIRWFSVSNAPSAEDPYYLYAISNAGSLIALLGYPLVIEPSMTRVAQSNLWAAGYGLYAALAAACAWVTYRNAKAAPEDPVRSDDSGTSKIAWAQRFTWVMLAFVPSSYMLSLTAFMTTDLAAIPLLWVIPLGLYLLTFIIAFARSGPTAERVSRRLVPGLGALSALFLVSQTYNPLWLSMGIHVLAFFVGSLLCHCVLASLRPAASSLTEFFFWVSVGGVLGGMFNVLVAPALFDDIYEFAIAIILVTLISGLAKERLNPRLVLLAAAPVAAMLVFFGIEQGLATDRFKLASNLVVVGLPLFGVYLLSRRLSVFGVSLAMWMIGAALVYSETTDHLQWQERSFFGVHRVTLNESLNMHVLHHGTTVHGAQFLDEDRRRIPATYFHPQSPIAQVFQVLRGQPIRVGIVGLGAGNLLAYIDGDDTASVFEIDPLVIKVARDTGHFSFWKDAVQRGATLNDYLGDGRLKIADRPDHSFDFLILDAFSSDSLPVHLITTEAVDMYLKKITPSGLLAFNASNQYLKVDQAVGQVSAALGAPAWVQHQTIPPAQESIATLSSSWVIVTKNPEFAQFLDQSPAWTRLQEDPSAAWTDDYSSLLDIIK